MSNVIDFAKAANDLIERDADEEMIELDPDTAATIQRQLGMALERMGEGHAMFLGVLSALQHAYALSDKQIAHHLEETYSELHYALKYYNPHWAHILEGKE